jgi:hypothetical protein
LKMEARAFLKRRDNIPPSGGDIHRPKPSHLHKKEYWKTTVVTNSVDQKDWLII